MGYIDRDHLWERVPSTLSCDQMIHLKRADLFEKVLIGQISRSLPDFSTWLRWPKKEKQRYLKYDYMNCEGLALASAVLFGALLDRRVWPEFLARVGFPIIDFRAVPSDIEPATHPIRAADRIWMTLPLPQQGGKERSRRWVADPLTHLLLRRFQVPGGLKARRAHASSEHLQALVNASQQAEARDGYCVYAIGEAFGISDWSEDRLTAFADALLEASVIKWRTKMPSFIIENLLEGGQSTSLPEADWVRLLGKNNVRLEKEKRSLGPNEHRKPREETLRVLLDALPADRARPSGEFVEASKTLLKASRDRSRQAVDRDVLRWASARLDPLSDPKQRKRRLAPSVIRKRAWALFNILSKAFGKDDLQSYEKSELAKKLNETLGFKSKVTNEALDHVRCFLDWHNRANPHLALEVQGETERKDGSPAAGIVTAYEYQEILNRLNPEKSNNAAVRLLLMLGFRAGLRWEEAVHLNVDDIRQSGSHMELQIRNNSTRRTKSMAGRRVLPLHLLFADRELKEFRDWWKSRVAETSASCIRLATTDAKRMFPQLNEDFVRQLKRDIEHEIQCATGYEKAVFHQLRHSFASYLIATLALPYDVPDNELILPVDRSVLSHERRRKFASALLGEGRLGLNAVRAASSLLGHSGERSTLHSYFHLHDWLAGNFVNRAAGTLEVPLALAANLLETEESELLQEIRKNQDFNVLEKHDALDPDGYIGKSPSRPTFRLREFLFHSDPAITPSSPQPKYGPSSATNQGPDWKILTSYMGASTAEERQHIRGLPKLANPYGQEVIRQLDEMLASKTRGRKGISKLRFVKIHPETRQRSVRRLDSEECRVLAKIFSGFSDLDVHKTESFSKLFLNGYNITYGLISIPSGNLEIFLEILEGVGLPQAEIHVEPRGRATHIRLGKGRNMHRGYVWGILFGCAIHGAKRARKTAGTVDSAQSTERGNP